MKSVMVGTLAAIAIAVVAGAVLNSIDQTSAQKYSTDNVRVN